MRNGEEERNEKSRQSARAVPRGRNVRVKVHKSALCVAVGEIHVRIVVPVRCRCGVSDGYPDQRRSVLRRITRLGMSHQELMVPTRAQCLTHDGQGGLVRRNKWLHCIGVACTTVMGFTCLSFALAAVVVYPPKLYSPVLWMMTAYAVMEMMRVYRHQVLPQQLAAKALALVDGPEARRQQGWPAADHQ